jgi:hypothetical protein
MGAVRRRFCCIAKSQVRPIARCLPATGRKRHMKKTLICLSAADLKDVPEPCDFLFEAER